MYNEVCSLGRRSGRTADALEKETPSARISGVGRGDAVAPTCVMLATISVSERVCRNSSLICVLCSTGRAGALHTCNYGCVSPSADSKHEPDERADSKRQTASKERTARKRADSSSERKERRITLTQGHTDASTKPGSLLGTLSKPTALVGGQPTRTPHATRSAPATPRCSTISRSCWPL